MKRNKSTQTRKKEIRKITERTRTEQQMVGEDNGYALGGQGASPEDWESPTGGGLVSVLFAAKAPSGVSSCRQYAVLRTVR
jgi:hypothetical protein